MTIPAYTLFCKYDGILITVIFRVRRTSSEFIPLYRPLLKLEKSSAPCYFARLVLWEQHYLPPIQIGFDYSFYAVNVSPDLLVDLGAPAGDASFGFLPPDVSTLEELSGGVECLLGGHAV